MSTPEYIGNTVISSDRKLTGKVISTKACRLESCNGLNLGTRWEDGRLSWPCTKGMDFDEATNSWSIPA